MLKTIFRSAPIQGFLTFLLWLYLGAVRHFIRYDVINPEVIARMRAGGGAIVCFWHGRIPLALAAWKPGAQRAEMLISLSPDGEFIARAVSGHGVGVIRGSAANPKKRQKAKGGIAAFRAMIAHLNSGGVVAITPDGPRGPRMHAGAGPLRLAARSGAPIYVFGISAAHRRLMSSWDRLTLPFPFGRGVVVWKGPFHVPGDADEATLEAARLELEAALRNASEEADRLTGHQPVKPARLSPEPRIAADQRGTPTAQPEKVK